METKPSPRPVSSTVKPSQVLKPSLISKRRHVHASLNAHSAQPRIRDGEMLGISIAGWEIETTQGPIADATWLDQALEELQPLSQCQDSSTHRQIVLPEMLFSQAKVHLQYKNNNEDEPILSLSWNAMECLTEWATAHQSISLPISDEDAPTVSSRGVNVLQSMDATLWKQNRRHLMSDNETTSSPHATATISDTTFHYDWTYSTPFVGSTNPQPNSWIPRSTPMPMQLLTDQTVPILYFDHVVLMEDDLHDNGLMQYNAKLRVMPTCAYVLCQLLVRVDQVLMRVRETRLLLDFEQATLYRDVTWRECAWKDLPQHGLPTHVKAWTLFDRPDPAALAQQLQRLPLVELPPDILPHAKLEYRP